MCPPDEGRDGSPTIATARERGALRPFVVRVDGEPDTGDAALGPLTIGSHPGCGLRLDDPRVSRFHCELVATGDGVRIKDLGSKNGTYVDGLRVFDALVRDGSVVELGATRLVVGSAAELVPVPASASARFGRLRGDSVAMRRTFALLEAAAATDATVLLEGESGSGKEGAAEALHDAGARAGGPFVVVDCGAIPADLLESELFGHEKGAFTGAQARRIGAFEEASGGTLFLDEIGELPLDMQPKLLRALEQRVIRRVGTNAYQPIDVRVVAATNRDLRARVNDGGFRADLYYRLAVVRVRIPPLRERPDDIPPIATAILESMGAPPALIDELLAPRELARMQAAAWPGNVRELRNHLERCLVFSRPLPVTDDALGAGPPAPAPRRIDPAVPYEEARRDALDAWEADYVAALLAAHGGHVERAAAAARVARAHLYRLAGRHGLVGRGRKKP